MSVSMDVLPVDEVLKAMNQEADLQPVNAADKTYFENLVGESQGAEVSSAVKNVESLGDSFLNKLSEFKQGYDKKILEIDRNTNLYDPTFTELRKLTVDLSKVQIWGEIIPKVANSANRNLEFLMKAQ